MTLAERIIEDIEVLFSAPELPHFTDDDITPPWESCSPNLMAISANTTQGSRLNRRQAGVFLTRRAD